VEAADRGGGVDHVAHPGGVQRLPSAGMVEHLHHVGNQDVVVGVRVTGPGGGVPGAPEGQAGRRGADLEASPPAALALDPGVEEGHGGVGLGVEDLVHVVGSTDDAEHGDGLVGGDDQLHAGPLRRRQPRPEHGISGAAVTEHGVVVLRLHLPREAQSFGTGAAPHHGGLAFRAVVGEGLAGEVIGPAQHDLLVVADRSLAHHRHPRHRGGPSPQPERLQSCSRPWFCSGVSPVGTGRVQGSLVDG
jgi:hypothetical protein